MTPSQMLPELIAEHRELARRVETLEQIVREQNARRIAVEMINNKTTANKVTDIRAYTREVQAKYAKYPSFARALRAERDAERKREQAALHSRRIRANGVSTKRKRTSPSRKTTRASAKR